MPEIHDHRAGAEDGKPLLTDAGGVYEGPVDRAEREMRIFADAGLPGLPVNGLDEDGRRELSRRTGVPAWIVRLMDPERRRSTRIADVLSADRVMRRYAGPRHA